MIKISHRGNIGGPLPERENSPDYIQEAISRGFEVKIDVWYQPVELGVMWNPRNINDGWFLGHDGPKHKIDFSFLMSKDLWCQAKNLKALQTMINYNILCFWHQEDDFSLTSTGHIWTRPDKMVCKNSILVCQTLEKTLEASKKNIYGVCSDYVSLI